jgi:hypothetical protein
MARKLGEIYMEEHGGKTIYSDSLQLFNLFQLWTQQLASKKAHTHMYRILLRIRTAQARISD